MKKMVSVVLAIALVLSGLHTITVFAESEEGVIHKTYGISAKNFSGKVSASFPDIFFNKRCAENLVNLCNENKLELCHLSDVIEDALT